MKFITKRRTQHGSPYARCNLSNEATVECYLSTGNYMKVSKGIYTSGLNIHKQCVAKEFKSKSKYSTIRYLNDLLHIKNLAIKIISAFNKSRICPDYTIELNIPSLYDNLESTQNVIIEPYISNFVKINSNTGWTSSEISPWIDIMQALSHYSYHTSNGEHLLCDIQGGALDYYFVISAPVIMSKLDVNCGPANLGPKGISTFFSRHVCNKYCGKYWILPSDVKCYYEREEGSIMADEVKLLIEMVEEMEISESGKCSDAKLERLVGKLDI